MAMTIMALILLMLPSAAMAQSTDVQVFDVDNYQKSITAGDTASFRWSIYNGGNSSLLIDTYAGARTSISASPPTRPTWWCCQVPTPWSS